MPSGYRGTQRRSPGRARRPRAAWPMCDPARVEAALPHVRRVARAGVLALCDRIERAPGTTLYSEGAAHFATADERIAITPPFRFEHWAQSERIDTAPLREHLAAPRLVGLLVVRLGGYGAGVYAVLTRQCRSLA